MLMQVFAGVYGIGGKRASELYDLGARSLADLRNDPDKYRLSFASKVCAIVHLDENSRTLHNVFFLCFVRSA